ncbi:MAG: 4Fe-4S binding protein [Chlamydiia bacterium]|nr:4Fe-4S binding protein [Chlamydiia bacterium]
MQRSAKRWERRRHMTQALLALFFILAPLPLPWLPGLEQGLIKVDFDNWRMHFFGITLVPGILHLFALGLIFLLFCIAVMATLYGKVFCGWFCPQNIFYESFETVHDYLRKYYPRYRKSLSLQKACDLGMALASASLVTYIFSRYFIGASPIFTYASSTFLMLFITIDTHWMKHKFCKNACPYAFLQQSFNDTSSLHVAYNNRPGSPCGMCKACVKACYVDLDIKKDTFHIDCTLCGSCVDACERVFSRSDKPALLSYQFGAGEHKPPFNILGINSWRKLFVVAAFACFCLFFASMIALRPSIQMRVDYPMGGGRGDQMVPYLEGTKTTNRFTLRLKSLSSTIGSYSFTVDAPYELQWISDPSELTQLDPYETIKLDFKVQMKQEPDSLPFFSPITFTLLSSDGKVAATQESVFKPVPKAGH